VVRIPCPPIADIKSLARSAGNNCLIKFSSAVVTFLLLTAMKSAVPFLVSPILEP